MKSDLSEEEEPELPCEDTSDKEGWSHHADHRGDIALDEAILDAQDDRRSSIYYV